MPPAPHGCPEEERNMAWKTPKIVEISVAMEINSYACAEI
ncbi:pyrroloquinoline quinone precursor peptide PqqA [Muricoccus roseus]|nr:pyrroloquinoline quinone precursor peptide PqqA [Roseomonas rosea]